MRMTTHYCNSYVCVKIQLGAQGAPACPMLMFDDGTSEMLPAVEECPDPDDLGSATRGAGDPRELGSAGHGAGAAHEVEVGPTFSLSDIRDSDVAGHGAGNDEKLNNLLTHTPADVTHCETCMRAKTRSLHTYPSDQHGPLQSLVSWSQCTP